MSDDEAPATGKFTATWVSTQGAPECLDPSVARERRRQIEKWGIQHHSPEWWLTILSEEVGELAKEILELKFEKGSADSMRSELVQVAAVALSWLADLDGRLIVGADARLRRQYPEVLVPDPDRWWLSRHEQVREWNRPLDLTRDCAESRHADCAGCDCTCHFLDRI